MYPETIGLSKPSLKRTREEKIQAMIEYLTKDHLEFSGGYAYDFAEEGDFVFVASLAADLETSADVYSKDLLVDWYDAAIKAKRTDRCDFIEEALVNCAPREVTG